MQDNELHKLGKTDLLTIIYEQEKKIEQLTKEIEELQRQLEDRTIKIKEAGSIAEASMKINKIFEVAQQAADEYLKSIKEVNKPSHGYAEIKEHITNDETNQETPQQENLKNKNTDENLTYEKDNENIVDINKNNESLIIINNRISVIKPKLLKRIIIFFIQALTLLMVLGRKTLKKIRTFITKTKLYLHKAKTTTIELYKETNELIEKKIDLFYICLRVVFIAVKDHMYGFIEYCKIQYPITKIRIKNFFKHRKLLRETQKNYEESNKTGTELILINNQLQVKQTIIDYIKKIIAILKIFCLNVHKILGDIIKKLTLIPVFMKKVKIFITQIKLIDRLKEIKSKIKDNQKKISKKKKSKKQIRLSKNIFTIPSKTKIDVSKIKISIQELEKELKRRKEKKLKITFARTLVYSVMVIVAFAIITSSALFKILQVSGSSMEPTLHAGELLITSKYFRFERGDIIAFYYNDSVLIKRVIAMEGDTVYIEDNGEVYVNSTKLEENYVKELSYGNCDIEFPYQVPEDSVFILGDNREVSIDSRSKSIGCISNDKIIGKIQFKLNPFVIY